MWYNLRTWQKDQPHNLFGWDLCIWPEFLFAAERSAAGDICSKILVFNDPRCHFPKENRRLVQNYESPLAPRTLNMLAEMYSMGPFWTYADWDTSSCIIFQRHLVPYKCSHAKYSKYRMYWGQKNLVLTFSPLPKNTPSPPFFVSAALKRSQVYNIFCQTTQTHH